MLPDPFSPNPIFDAHIKRYVELVFGVNWGSDKAIHRLQNTVQSNSLNRSVYWNPRTPEIKVRTGGILNDPQPAVPASLAFSPEGSIIRATHYKNGKRMNPPSQNPAETLYYPSGEIKAERWFTNSILASVTPGSPCNVEYKKTGKVHKAFSQTVSGQLRKYLRKEEVRVWQASRRLQSVRDIVSYDTEIIALAGITLSTNSSHASRRL